MFQMLILATIITLGIVKGYDKLMPSEPSAEVRQEIEAYNDYLKGVKGE